MRSVRLPQILRRTKRPTSTTRHESETVLTLVSFSRREEEEKIFFPPKIVSCFFVFFSWSRVARWKKKKLTVPLSVPSPLVVLRRAQLTDFYMFPLGTMCEKREGKGSYRWGRMCEMLQCDIGGFSPSSVHVVFSPPPSSCPS